MNDRTDIPRPTRLEIFRVHLPMRGFEHAAAARKQVETILLCQHFADGGSGWGQALARPYVTGESAETVVDDLTGHLWPEWVAACGKGLSAEMATASAAIRRTRPDGTCCNAAAGALEIASAPRMRLPALSRRISPRVSGVLGSSDPGKTARRLRLMRWFGLRDFKLKLGLGERVDAENLRVVTRRIGRAVRKGTCTLRVDVNGGWDPDELPDRAEQLASLGVCAIEQPCFGPAEQLVELARGAALPLMADESLLTVADGETLAAAPGRVWWNVRIGKNGGIAPTLDLLARARQAGVTVTLGCMVGETSLLSAWQRVVLAAAPDTVRFVEGNYGRFLLRVDPARPHLRFGFGGRLRPLGRGLGGPMRVDRRQLAEMGEQVADLRM